MPVNGQKNGAAASNTSSRTSDWKAAFDTVICPLCGAPTVQAFINAHIDSQCQKHIRTIASPPQPRPQQPQRPKRAAPSDAAVPRPSRPRMLGHASHCRPNDPAAAAAAHVAAARYLRPSTLELPRARLQPLTADGASWVLHVPGWGRFDDRPANGGFENLWHSHPQEHAKVVMFGKELTCARYSQMYGVDYVYSGQTARARPLTEVEAGPHLMRCFQRICRLVHHESQQRHGGVAESCVRAVPNAVLLNWYADGAHYMGAHSDDETQLLPNAPIFSVS
jgi:alkylated DNA repair dioxygenase AlkB